MSRLAILLAAMLAAPAFGLCETPPPPPPAPPAAPAPPLAPPPDMGRWWKNSEVASNLKLSTAQIAQIEQTYQENRMKLIDLRAEVERQELRLEPLVEADQIDEARIGAQIDAVLAARAKLEKTHVMMMLAIRKVLTIEQWKKLEEMKERAPRAPGAPRTPAPSQPPRPPRAPDQPPPF